MADWTDDRSELRTSLEIAVGRERSRGVSTHSISSIR
jgi:hypothetical protein